MGKTFIADKETLDAVHSQTTAILTALMDEDVYGFIEHMDVLSPTERIEYIGINKNFTPLTVTMGGGFSLGDWDKFPLIVNNKPYMVKSSGDVDYELSATDYTKKKDGTTASDVANQSYGGGAFSWLQKIYKKEDIVGSDRIVKFSIEPREGYEAVGFIDPDDHELEGVWIPMFYGSIDGNSKMLCVSGNQPCANNQTSAEKTAIDNFGSRAKFFGGAIVETLQDLLIMWAKTTNTQAAYGYGNCNGYDANDTYKGVKANAVVNGGQFYGTGSSDKTHLNKILHSIVLGSWQQWMRDPYTLCINGRVKVSKNYKYALDGSGYTDTGIQYPTAETSGVYPHKYAAVKGFGAVPVAPYSGSSSLGGCDILYNKIDITAVALRFGDCTVDLKAGFRALDLDGAATTASWHIGAAVLLLPPVGASPSDAA